MGMRQAIFMLTVLFCTCALFACSSDKSAEVPSQAYEVSNNPQEAGDSQPPGGVQVKQENNVNVDIEEVPEAVKSTIMADGVIARALREFSLQIYHVEEQYHEPSNYYWYQHHPYIFDHNTMLDLTKAYDLANNFMRAITERYSLETLIDQNDIHNNDWWQKFQFIAYSSDYSTLIVRKPCSNTPISSNEADYYKGTAEYHFYSLDVASGNITPFYKGFFRDLDSGMDAGLLAINYSPEYIVSFDNDAKGYLWGYFVLLLDNPDPRGYCHVDIAGSEKIVIGVDPKNNNVAANNSVSYASYAFEREDGIFPTIFVGEMGTDTVLFQKTLIENQKCSFIALTDNTLYVNYYVEQQVGKINIHTGEEHKYDGLFAAEFALSPDERYLAYFDLDAEDTFCVLDFATGELEKVELGQAYNIGLTKPMWIPNELIEEVLK